MRPLAVNFHLYKPCNYRCQFCFATFRDVEGVLSLEDAKRLITQLREAGCDKLTFAGGEPTLHPHLGELLVHAKEEGLVTSLVTNGARLERLLETHPEVLDWVALSVDSGDEETQKKLGRGNGKHVQRACALAALCRDRQIRLKLNTVVTRLNWEEDLSWLVRSIQPVRWKVFQVLRVEGQNDGAVEPLLITGEEFRAFLRRHEHLATEGYPAVSEANEAMLDSYVMIDPVGRFYGDTGGKHRVSPPILEVGVAEALATVGYREEQFEARGGRYDWRVR